MRELAALDDAKITRLLTFCQQRSEEFEKKCLACEATIFCKAYCAMAAIRNNSERLCQSQVELISIMRDNLPLTVMIANSYQEYLRKTRLRA